MLIHCITVISNRTKWAWEISIYLFSITLACSLDFSIIASQLMSKWPGWFYGKPMLSKSVIRTERSECEKSKFTFYPLHLHAVLISQSLLRNSCRNDCGVLKYADTLYNCHFEPNEVSVRNLNLPVFNHTYMQSRFLNRCFATHFEMTRLGYKKRM